jgi:hypothetical protein
MTLTTASNLFAYENGVQFMLNQRVAEYIVGFAKKGLMTPDIALNSVSEITLLSVFLN